ncbi:hypothetical protein RWH43_17015 [Microbacterium sp. KSW2-21]|uniref:Uncharacterized protein n=1 Tax=Microbacterium algihabitans TaxID=3075992 RepID=A0ABU3S006_9MICO|nr:hypothetical protein [Microbacterium sp. KSW2-21]MDU0328462.1 hypothetical protein [Microbacterium sp. KSW2-21]
MLVELCAHNFVLSNERMMLLGTVTRLTGQPVDVVDYERVAQHLHHMGII